MGNREEFGKIYMNVILFGWFVTRVLLVSTVDTILIWDRNDFDTYSSYVFLAFLLIQIVFFQKYQFKEIMLILLITVPFAFASIESKYYVLMSSWIFIVASKNIDFDTIAKIAYYSQLFMSLFIFYMFYSGVISEFLVYRNSVLRHSLGFSHPNQLGIRVFLIVVCRCYIRRNKFNIIDWIVIILSAIFVHRVADSKTSLIALLLLAIVTLFNIIMKKAGGNLRPLASTMIVITALCSVVSVFMCSIQVRKYPLLSSINRFMSGRFSCCNRVLNYYGIKLFGQNVELIIDKSIIGKYYHFWLDNAYMALLIRYGPIVLAIFVVLYLSTMIILRNMNEYLLVEIFCIYAIYGIMENSLFSFSRNMFLLLLSYPLYKRTRKKEDRGLIKQEVII